MRRLVLILMPIMFFLSTSHTFAATWARTYGGNGDDNSSIPVHGFYSSPTNAIQQTSDGGYIVAGFNADGGTWVIKLDGTGSIQWQKTYGGSPYAIQQAGDGGYILAGVATRSQGVPQPWVARLRADGGVQWQKLYESSGGGVIMSVRQVSGGGYVATGWSNAAAGSTNAFALRLDSGGAILWKKDFIGSNSTYAFSVRQTPDGGFIMAGAAAGPSTSGDAWVVKMNTIGNIQWRKGYRGISQINDIQVTTDGGYVVAGWVSSSIGSSDACAVKLDPNGNIQWVKAYGGNDLDGANSIRETSGGGYIMAGTSRSFGSGSSDAWVLKLDPNGTIRWQKVYGGGGDDWASSADQTTDGGYVFVGGTSSFGAGGADILVAKLDGNGEIADGCSLVGQAGATVRNSTVTTINVDLTARDSTVTVLTGGQTAEDTQITPGGICVAGTLAVPRARTTYNYLPILTPSLDSDPSLARPIGLGDVAGVSGDSTLTLSIGFLVFDGPVDIYLALHAPAISSDLYLIKPDLTLSRDLVKWKAGTEGPISEVLYEGIPVGGLPPGTYSFYAAVTPKNSPSAYSIWVTSFTVP